MAGRALNRHSRTRHAAYLAVHDAAEGTLIHASNHAVSNHSRIQLMLPPTW